LQTFMKNREYINVPTLFTSLNLFCGFASVILATSGDLDHAAWLIFIACVFDALDGRIARLSGRSSDFGIQIDSLADVVSSGLTISILVYCAYLKELGLTGLIISFMPLIFAAFRLARFNVLTLKKGKSKDYMGLPAPSAAVALSSVVILYGATQWPFLHNILVFYVPAISLLMASTINYDGFPRFSLREKGSNRLKLILFFITLILLPIFPQYTLFGFTSIYVLSGPIGILRVLMRNKEAKVELIPEKVIKGKDDKQLKK
jgi:CDP-diacylglycerol---serine O-phosphatidyltransferase